MLFLEIKYHLLRNRARSLLLVCTAAVLCGCIAFFLNNSRTTQQALEQLNEASPATLRLTNNFMSTFDRLTIRASSADDLVELGLQDIKAFSGAVGYLNTDYLNDISNYDVELLAVTNLEAIGFSSLEGIEYAPGADASFLEGEEPLVLMSREFAEENNVSLGDTLSMHLRQKLFTSQSLDFFQWISEERFELRVQGFFGEKNKAEHIADLYLPSKWLRIQVENADLLFYYDSFFGSLTDSMKLNEFKAGLETLGYRQPYAMDPLEAAQNHDADLSSGTTAVMEDKTFIRAAEKLGTSLQYYRILTVPLFLLAIGVITLAVFLVLRGSRRDMAISCSLGQPKRKIAAAHFLAVLIAQAAGYVLTLPLLLLLGISPGTLLTALGAFFLCSLPGNAIGLLVLLRFEPMTLLIQSE